MNYLGDKPSSKVLRPPGGGSNNIFGVAEETTAGKKNPKPTYQSSVFSSDPEPEKPKSAGPGRMASNIFGTDNNDNSVTTPKKVSKTHQSSLFQDPEPASGNKKVTVPPRQDPITGGVLGEAKDTPVAPVSSEIKNGNKQEPKVQKAPVVSGTQKDLNPHLGPIINTSGIRCAQPPGGKSSFSLGVVLDINSFNMEAFSNWFWQDYFWLPQGVSFKDLKDRPGFVYAKPRDLFYVPVVGLGIYFVRVIYERFIALPLAKRFGVPDGSERKSPQPNKQLEEFFKDNSNPSEAEITGLSKQLDWSTLAIKRWFRRKRNLNRPTLQTKFCEASWRCMFYTFVFTFGIATLWQTPWFWDNLQCWVDYPRQSVEQATYIYYMLEASFYVSLLFTVMQDVKRKDFKVQLIHHVATLFLIGFSYVANFVRVGTLVMAVHDISDIFLEGAKCFIYMKWNNFADVLFVFFALAFLISRLVIFPFWIIHTTFIKSMWLFDPYPGYYFFNALLMVLQVLHIFWSYLILRMAFFMLTAGKVEKDDRSDVEEYSTDEDEKSAKHKKESINHDKNSPTQNDNHSTTMNGPTKIAKNKK